MPLHVAPRLLLVGFPLACVAVTRQSGAFCSLVREGGQLLVVEVVLIYQGSRDFWLERRRWQELEGCWCCSAA